jgi:hypothetical protein
MAVRVVLGSGQTAKASARFSPDVSGPGEPVKGACERTAVFFRVVPPGGGTVLASVRPHTPVCEQGQMVVSVFTRG